MAVMAWISGMTVGRLRRRVTSILKVLIAAVLVFALFYYRLITLDAVGVLFRNLLSPQWYSDSFLLLTCLSAIRWLFLLRAMGIDVALRPCFEIFAIKDLC